MQNAATRKRWPRSVVLEMALEQKAIGRQIARLRDQQRLTQPQLADRVGVSLRALQDWEAGEAQPRWRNLSKLAEELQVAEEEIIGHRENAPSPSLNGDGPEALARLEEVTAQLKRIETTLEGIVSVLDAMGEASESTRELFDSKLERLLRGEGRVRRQAG